MEPEKVRCKFFSVLSHRMLWLTSFPRIKLLTGELKPLAGHQTRNGRLRVSVNISSFVSAVASLIVPLGHTLRSIM